MIVVTGATGHLGTGVVESLLNRLPADRVVATARDVSKAADFARRGVTVRVRRSRAVEVPAPRGETR